MKFEKPIQNIDLPKAEEGVLQTWREKQIFQRSIDEKKETERWPFYDGPPFATGLPHHGHLLAGTIKDVIPRYWSMRGKRIERRFGWDCHGLPVEFEMEKSLELNGRKDILEYGVDKFNEACRGIVLRYTAEWQKTTERLGRWIDFEHDYKTMDPDFMESVWHVFKTLWDKGLIYEDKKVLPYSARITTPLSNFEANLNYHDVQDPSITVKFPVKDRKNTFLVIWTTTPWTLPANMAIAAKEDFEYVEVEHKKSGEIYILFEGLAPHVFAHEGGEKAYEIKKRMKGKDLQGLQYSPIFKAFEGQLPETAHKVVLGDFVTADTGTGLVHIAPAFGEDDFEAGKANNIPPLDHLDDEGIITNAVPDFEGLNFKDADKKIITYLKEEGWLIKQETYQHSYPYCYRSDTPLIYRAISTWFVDVGKIKDELIANNKKIHWVPEHLKEGRFGKWLEGARDWAISRNRFWGNPIPIWINEDTGEKLCVGSREELEKLSGKKVEDLHKHFVDEIEIKSPKTGDTLKRIPHVLDCWFESGSMPFAQQHYPFSISEKEFEKIFPAEFIAEGLDQTRGWFYTLLVLSTALGKGHPFKNVVVNGIVLAEDGRKMSKRLKNYPDPIEVFEKYGADTLRIYLLQSGAVRAEDLRFSEEGLREMTRKVLLPFWNAYSFLATYASVDGWDPKKDYTDDRNHLLDHWIKVKLMHLKREIHQEMTHYHLSKTVPPLLAFLDDLTNWYIRRSRRRFWKSENDSDKNEAYSTLYEVLCEFSKLAAPFIPFLTETIYQRLNLGHELANKDSVHLENYPESRELTKDEKDLEYSVDLARQIVELGRELREKLKLKVRQPLASLFVGTTHADDEGLLGPVLHIIKEELNVKDVAFKPIREMASWSVKPNFRLLGKRLGPRMKEFQKAFSELSDQQVFQLLAGKEMEVLGETFSKECFVVELDALEDFQHACHASGAAVVALDTNLTAELKNEGLAREVINRVQRLRKEIDLNVDDRIDLAADGPKELQSALEDFRDLVETETLSKLSLKAPEKGMSEKTEKVDGSQVRIAIRKSA